ncbi:doublesex- and mab-3-related transcription factor 1-like [Brachyistius frenatus]|uniref:doublesex- and mab-3-related transcription factor 1-like n=1 Tax=Brachyistius frenatus TaxID=100188 RepID=UPI0037E97F3F
MSSSKDQPAERPRQPKCSRCRNHGVIIPLKGHTKSCPFVRCECWKCGLVTERTRITGLQRKRITGKKGPKVTSGTRTPEGDPAPATEAVDLRRRPEATGRPEAAGRPEASFTSSPAFSQHHPPPPPDFWPWFLPLPAALYNDYGPVMFPVYQQGAVHQPLPQEPAADCRRVYITLHPPPLPETSPEELVSRHT